MPTTASKPGRVLIVDDHPAVREAMALCIRRQRDLEVCGEAANIEQALRSLEESDPDVAVIDISLKNENGIDLIKLIRNRNHRVRILVWSMHNESLFGERALRCGAQGYINKEQPTDQIIEAIRRVWQGQVFLSETLAERMRQRKAMPSPAEVLADRELEVFRLIGHGIKTADIAQRMHLSIKTVETYRDRIRQKLDLNEGTRLTQFAEQWTQENE